MTTSRRARTHRSRQEGNLPRTRDTRMFAMIVPGMAPLATKELAEVDGVEVSEQGFDGRSDVVLFDASRSARADVMGQRFTEDVFVEVGRTRRSEGNKARWVSDRIWRPARTMRALSIWAEERGPLRSRMTFRVIVRVLEERAFLRTDLRAELVNAIRRDRPKWRFADPADLEVWITE